MKHDRFGSRRWAFVLLAGIAACTGSGSDIGPSFPELPAGTCKATVRDNQGLGVSGAVVRVADGVGVTGRTGRAELYGDRRGTRIVRVDASNASAKDTDRLASIVFETSVQGPDLPDVVHLPDTGPSATVTLGTGAALPATDLDDSVNSGAILRIPAGTVLADGANASVQLRIGELAAEHLPSPLPLAPVGSWLCTRAFWVDPPTVTFAPSATLVVPDEIALGSGSGSLFRLDPSTGQWQQVVGTAVGSGGTIQLANGVSTGGLHVYAVAGASATVRGRVVDVNDVPIYGALVRVDSAMTNTGTDGRFEVVVAGVDGAGSTRNAGYELVGGGSWLSILSAGQTGPLGANASVDLGDLTFETTPAGDVRMQFIRRGRAVGSLPVVAGGGSKAVFSASYTDAIGQCTLEEIPAGWFGTSITFPISATSVATTELLSFLSAGSRIVSSRYYFSDRSYTSDGPSTRMLALDSVGRAPIQGAAFVRGRVANDGYLGVTSEGGAIFANRATFDRITATVRSAFGSEETTSAFSFEGPGGNRIEVPLERSQQRAPGVFDRHGIVRGQLIGADPLREQRICASRPQGISEWFAARMQDGPSYQNMPVRVGGSLPAGFYSAGVAQPLGSVVVAEGTVAGGLFSLTAVGALLDLQVGEGTASNRDLPLDRPATIAFAAPGALAGFDASFAASDLRFDLAFQQPSARIVDVAQDIAGNMTVSGSDMTFTLPALDGPLVGGAWLVALRAEFEGSGESRSQRLLLRLSANGSDVFPMLALPTIVSPTNGLGVSANGFTVQFASSPGATYTQIELRSEGADNRAWTAVVPASTTEFSFVQLPTEAVSPLIAGRTWILTLSSWRAEFGIYSDPAYYGELATFWSSLGAVNQGVRAGSSRSMTITTN